MNGYIRQYFIHQILYLMIFPLKLDLLMRRSGINQRGLGDAIGVSQKTVSTWVNGQVRPTNPKLLELARHFGVSVDVLVDDKAELPKADVPVRVSTESTPLGERSEERAIRALLQVRADLEAVMDRVSAIVSDIAQPDSGGKLARMLREDAEERAASRRAGQEEQRKTGQG